LVEKGVRSQQRITDTQLLIPLFFADNPRRHTNDPTNYAPVVLQISDQTSIAGESIDSLGITAFDVEGDSLRYSADGLPEGIFISSNVGFIGGAATYTGTYTVTIAVDDGIGAASTQQFVWTVFEFEPPTLPEVDGSVARLWNEVLLESIRSDFARPTVHARNLFHTSIGMYDAWAAYDETAETYCLSSAATSFRGFTFKPNNAGPL